MDMTLGHGYDTFLLAPNVKHIYAFDIQEDAIESAKTLNASHDNITYILDNFKHFKTYIASCDLAIFNLGYLPKGDKTITTLKEDTLYTLHKLIEENIAKHIVIMSYLGHEEGYVEYLEIKNYIQHVTHYHVIISHVSHDPKAPVMFWIYKK
jgi:methylase of polypeptide subunit release factors